MSQEDIYAALLSKIPKGTHHVSGGLPDARGMSDVDIYLPTKSHTDLLKKMPKGTVVTKSNDLKTMYSIPGYDREVNLYATMDPQKEESIHHRATMLELAKRYPELAEKAFKIKAKGKGSEPAWAEVLGLKGDPYEVMADTDKVLSHAAKRITKTAGEDLYRPRGTIFVTDGKGNIYAGKKGADSAMEATSPYYFPGGGLLPEGVKRAPTKKEVLLGMRQEALEELGMKLKQLRVLRGKPVRMDMPEWWVARNFKKRGIEYKGLDEYYGHAREGKKDMSQYNSEGDAFQGRYYPIKTVTKALREHGAHGGEYSQGNLRQADLLSKLSSAPKRMSEEDRASIVEAYRKAVTQLNRLDHPTQRLAQRTTLPAVEIDKLRQAIAARQAAIPSGEHYVPLRDGSRAVIKDIGDKHVLATILSGKMNRYPSSQLELPSYTSEKVAAAMLGNLMRRGVSAGAGAVRRGAGAVRRGASNVKNYNKNRMVRETEFNPESRLGRLSDRFLRPIDEAVAKTTNRVLTGGKSKTLGSDAKRIIDKGFYNTPTYHQGAKNTFGNKAYNFYTKKVAPAMSSRATNLAFGGAGVYGVHHTMNNKNSNWLTKGLTGLALAKSGGGLFSRGLAAGTRNAGQHWAQSGKRLASAGANYQGFAAPAVTQVTKSVSPGTPQHAIRKGIGKAIKWGTGATLIGGGGAAAHHKLKKRNYGGKPATALRRPGFMKARGAIPNMRPTNSRTVQNRTMHADTPIPKPVQSRTMHAGTSSNLGATRKI